ncbi:uncharacterized protein [Rutidosis leptorrhynchoides]|uniref:uncharacterized protein n=1 Tax=Rutidosis leptorrhynchoides TaxID=125765 RepID=UPI003A9928C3
MSLNVRGVGQEGKLNWLRSLCHKERPGILCLQETKCGQLEDPWFESFWGSGDFMYIQKYAQGFSGGMIMVWDPTVFKMDEAIEGEFYLAIKGHVAGCDTEIAVVNVYGPHSTGRKIRFWVQLESLLNCKDMPWLLCGDFNEVRYQSERFNSIFNQSWADLFNQFINRTCLIEVLLGGKKFTRICDNGVKFSKLDRFLVSDQLCHLWPNLSANTLDKHLSDHCPIVLRNGFKDFGPKPTRVFNEWLLLDGAVDIVVNAWNMPVSGNRPDCVLRNRRIKEVNV